MGRQRAHFRYLNTGLVVIGKPTYKQWEAQTKKIARLVKRAPWWLGDLLNYGEGVFPERHSQVLAATGLSYSTLRDYGWVADKFKPPRRRGALEWYPHRDVAGLEDKSVRRCRRSGHRGSPMLPSPARRKGPSKIRAEDGDTVTADARATGFRDRIRGNDV